MANTKRIVLLGKTGSGKSSLSNTIFGGNPVFTVDHSSNSHLSVCDSKTKTVYGRTLTLIDTPGLFDTNPNSSAFSSEIMRCLEKSAPGPHAFLLVLKVEKFTPLEKAVVDLILQYFSPEALRYTIVVFTHGDSLPPGWRIADWARGNTALRDLLEKCDNRCHVVDNQYWGNTADIYRNNQIQVQNLLNTIDLMVGASYFTNDLLLNKSLWLRFRDAPIGFQISVFMGVAAVGCLLYSCIPWAQISEWVVMGEKNGAEWIWQNLPTEEAIKEAIEHLSKLTTLYQTILPVLVGSQKSSSYCTVL